MPPIPSNFSENIETIFGYLPELYSADLSVMNAMLSNDRDVSLAAVNDFIVERCQDRIVTRGLFIVAQQEVGVPRALVSQNWGRFMRSVCLFYPHFVTLPSSVKVDAIIDTKERIGLDACTALLGSCDERHLATMAKAQLLCCESEADAVAIRLALDL